MKIYLQRKRNSGNVKKIRKDTRKNYRSKSAIAVFMIHISQCVKMLKPATLVGEILAMKKLFPLKTAKINGSCEVDPYNLILMQGDKTARILQYLVVV